MPKQRRHKARRRPRGRFPGLYKAVSAVLIAAAVVAACAVFFRVGDIQVTGNSRYTAQEIIDVAGVERGDNLFTLSAAGISRELQNRLPYIRAVSVRRLLPDTLSITVTEGKAVAAVAQGSKWWLMDGDGKLLEEGTSPGACATVTGVTPLAPAIGTHLAAGEEQAGRVENLRVLLAALGENGLLDDLNSVELSEDYRLTFVCRERFTVHISPTLEKGMEYWLKRFAAALNDPNVAENQDYTVEIMDDQRLRFIPN